MEPIVSIIIPVYNVQSFLDKCISSISEQSYSNLEIILVNDGSTDKSRLICEQWVKKDKRVTLINQSNVGLSAARNNGLKKAKGEYVLFIDSDDWIAVDMVEKMVKAFNDFDADMVTCQFVNVYENGSATINYESDKEKQIVDREQFIRLLLEDKEVTSHIWRKMFKRSLLPNIPFQEGSNFEDIKAMPGLVKNCQKFVLLAKPLVFYRNRRKSIIHTFSESNIFNHYSAVNTMLDEYLHLAPNLMKEVLNAKFISFRTILWDTCQITKTPKMNKLRKKLLYELKSIPTTSLNHPSDKLYSYTIRLLPFSVKFNLELAYWHLPIRVIRRIKEVFYYRKKLSENNFIIIATPNSGNLGDRAITFGEEKFILDYFPNFKRVNVPVEDLSIISFFKGKISNSDIVALQGGGNIGSLYPWIHFVQENALRKMKRKKVIIFPQTYYYSRTARGNLLKENTKKCYKRMKNLLVFTRDPKSSEFVKDDLDYSRVSLVPDIVLTLEPKITHQKRNGTLLILRDDSEKTMTDTQKEKILDVITNFVGLEKKSIDTHLHYDGISDDFAKKRIAELWDEYAKAKLVITDRLHGMLFAAITNTPCVVIPSKSYKVRGVYEQWLKDNDYIELVENIEELAQAIQKVMLVKTPELKRAKLNKAFDAMAKEISK